MHIYSRYDDLPALGSFDKAVGARFDGEPLVRVNKMAKEPFGPHSCIEFETGMPSDILCAGISQD